MFIDRIILRLNEEHTSNSKHYCHKIILVKKTRMNGTRRRSEEFQLTWDKVFQRDFDFVYLHQFD